MTLRKQFFLALSALSLALLLAVGTVSVSRTRLYLEQQLASHAQDTANALSATLGQALGKGDLVLAQTNVASIFDRGYFKSIAVLANDRSQLLKRETAEKVENVPLWFAAAIPIEASAGEAFVGSGWRQLGKVIVVSQPTLAYQHLWRTTSELLAWTIALCIAAGLAIHLLLHFILKPLRAIEKTARDVQAKRFEPIEYQPRAPELAAVVTAMNQMSHQVGLMLDAETAKAQALHKKAYLDDLTGLRNRAGLEVKLVELLEGDSHSSLASVVSVELDNLRLDIRAHGFAVGENVMRAVTRNAVAVFALYPSAILARSNEFSFIFVIDDVTETQATKMAKDLHNRIIAEIAGIEQAALVSVTMGAAFFRPNETRAKVFSRVDLALASARHSGHNSLVVHTAEPDPHNDMGSFGWRKFIETALAQDRLHLMRQPVVSLDEKRLHLHTEYLVRLVDEQGKSIAASRFVPMATRHHLMPELDRAVLTMALAQLSEGRQDSRFVAVNLSAQSIADADFMKWFAEQLSLLRGKAASLAVELPKFGVISNLGAAMQLRDLVRKHGGKFGIDNFSLDPDALTLLRQIAPDYLKLTGSLIAQIPIEETQLRLLQSFASLAHALDVTLIAVQVERDVQAAAVAVAGVDAAQGAYFALPK
jgi:diguanylate cyclase (GGDEF)-like protein